MKINTVLYHRDFEVSLQDKHDHPDGYNDLNIELGYFKKLKKTNIWDLGEASWQGDTSDGH